MRVLGRRAWLWCTLFLIAVCQLAFVGEAAAQPAAGRPGIRIYGGVGHSLDTWQGNGSAWGTFPGGNWVVGVAQSTTGSLFNGPDGSIDDIPAGEFFAFIEPSPLGTTPKVEVLLPDGRALVAVFAVSGANGSGEAWRFLGGNHEVKVAWTRDLVDRVGRGRWMKSSGEIDQSVRITVEGARGRAPEHLPPPATSAGFRLMGGAGHSLDSWQSNRTLWSTFAAGWVIGIARSLATPLLNGPDGAMVEVPPGEFLAFVEPAPLGSTAKVELILADGRAYSAVFAVNGVNGSGESWQRLDGSPELTVAWTRESADRVSAGRAMTSSGQVDYTLRVGYGGERPRADFRVIREEHEHRGEEKPH